MYMENVDSSKAERSVDSVSEEAKREDSELVQHPLILCSYKSFITYCREKLRPPIPSKTEVLLPSSPPYGYLKYLVNILNIFPFFSQHLPKDSD